MESGRGNPRAWVRRLLRQFSCATAVPPIPAKYLRALLTEQWHNFVVPWQAFAAGWVRRLLQQVWRATAVPAMPAKYLRALLTEQWHTFVARWHAKAAAGTAEGRGLGRRRERSGGREPKWGGSSACGRSTGPETVPHPISVGRGPIQIHSTIGMRFDRLPRF